jgi:hypothetical protein
MNFKRIILAAFGGFAAYFITHAVAAQRISQIPSRVSFSESNQDRNADRNGCDVRGNASAGGDLRHALSRRLGLRGRRALRSLIAIFADCSFVIHNYVNLDIGGKLTLEQSVAYFVEWIATGIVIGLIYRPHASTY